MTIRGTSLEEYFIRIMVGVIDDVVNARNHSIIAEAINFFNEIWILFNSDSTELWGVLSKRYPQWISNSSVSSVWTESTKMLQSHVLNDLDSTCVNAITLKLGESEMTVNFSSLSLFIFFMRFLHLIGNPSNIQNTDIHSSALAGISDLVSQMLRTKLNGNDVLRIYGDILYQTVIFQNHMLYSTSVTIALYTFTSIIISKCQSTTFSKRAIAQLYSILSCSLTSPCQAVVHTAIDIVCVCLLYTSAQLTLRVLYQRSHQSG